jgi:tetratricopeptide (TPR) repeat protein
MSPAAPKETYGEDDDPKRLIDVDQQTQAAIKESEAGNLTGAIDILQKLVIRRPDDAEAYLNLEVVLWRAGRTNDAIATLEAALKRGITRWEIRTKVGLCLALSGQGQRAIPFLEGMTADDPETMSALGVAYAQVNRRGDAIREFEHVLQIDPSNSVAAGILGAIQLEAKDYAAAEPLLRRALALDPSQAATQASLGDLLAETARPAEAITAWTAALALDAGQHDALYRLAIALAGAGRLDEARRYGERFLQVASPQAEAEQIAAVKRAIRR